MLYIICYFLDRDQFRDYDYSQMYSSMVKPAFIFDGRNIMNHKQLQQIGFEVYAIGKPFDSTVSMD